MLLRWVAPPSPFHGIPPAPTGGVVLGNMLEVCKSMQRYVCICICMHMFMFMYICVYVNHVYMYLCIYICISWAFFRFYCETSHKEWERHFKHIWQHTCAHTNEATFKMHWTMVLASVFSRSQVQVKSSCFVLGKRISLCFVPGLIWLQPVCIN